MLTSNMDMVWSSSTFQISPTATGRYNNALAYINDSLACAMSPEFTTTAFIVSESHLFCTTAQARTRKQSQIS